jgi:hypothetical protein
MIQDPVGESGLKLRAERQANPEIGGSVEAVQHALGFSDGTADPRCHDRWKAALRYGPSSTFEMPRLGTSLH